jgi:hypothetical protein
MSVPHREKPLKNADFCGRLRGGGGCWPLILAQLMFCMYSRNKRTPAQQSAASDMHRGMDHSEAILQVGGSLATLMHYARPKPGRGTARAQLSNRSVDRALSAIACLHCMLSTYPALEAIGQDTKMSTRNILPAEEAFWGKASRRQLKLASDEEIEAKYDSKAERIVTETNREKLLNFYEALKRPNYMDPRPFYQRRQRWSPDKQSQLVESFLINIPIPPLFVYEAKPNVYEVMDGQQRITAIKAFYSNQLTLVGLERWPELNGRTYSQLPDRIRAGIDRRSISWVTVLNESSENEEDAFSIKQLVFERLNTGGVKLSAQEIRNALFSGLFNDLLIDLSRLDDHRKAWGLPKYSIAEERGVPPDLIDKNFYLEMEDVEVILRFFALRHAEHYSKGMRDFLDSYMQRAKVLTSGELQALGNIYSNTIKLANEIYGDLVFRPFSLDKKSNTWAWGKRPQRAYADAVLVALSEFLSQGNDLIAARKDILTLTEERFRSDLDGVLVGRGNTKLDVLNRIKIIREIYDHITGL